MDSLTAFDQASASSSSFFAAGSWARAIASLRRVVAQHLVGVHELLDGLALGDLRLAALDLVAVVEQVEDADDRLPAVAAAPFRVEVDEVPGVARVLADRLAVEMVNEIRAEALLVLDLHRVERAAVRVNADEELVLRLERLERRPADRRPCLPPSFRVQMLNARYAPSTAG